MAEAAAAAPATAAVEKAEALVAAETKYNGPAKIKVLTEDNKEVELDMSYMQLCVTLRNHAERLCPS